MAVPDEESPLLQHDTPQRDSETQDDDHARSGYSSIASKHELASQLKGATPEDAAPDGKVYVVLAMLMLSVFVSSLDNCLVIATSGTIASEFDSLANADWLLTSYLVAVCATQPIYGKLSDIYGRKGVLIFSYVVFAVGCAMCGLGATLWQVVAGRVVAGFGGGGMMALVLVLIADLLPIRQVGTWRSYFNVFSAMGRCVGGPVGGFLADTIGWRWSFLGQCPLIMFVAALVAWKLPKSTNHPPLDTTKRSPVVKFGRIDIPGSVLIFCTIASLLLVLDLAGKKLSLDSPVMIGLICATLGFAAFFVLVEGYWATEPVFPLRLALDRDVATAYAVAALQLAAEFGVTSTVPLYFQVTQDAKAASAGARLLPGLIAYALGGVIAGIIISRSGRYKLLGLTGPLISCSGFLLLFLRWRGHTNLLESFLIVPGDFGSGITQTTAFIALSAGIDKADTAVALTGYSVCQQLGVAIGMSTTAAILQSHVRAVLARTVGRGKGTRKIVERSISDIGYIQSLTGAVKAAIVSAYVEGLSYTYIYSLSLAACAVVAACLIRERRL